MQFNLGVDSWHRSSASAELHVFADVGHCWRMDGPGYFFDIWTKLLENWLCIHRFI